MIGDCGFLIDDVTGRLEDKISLDSDGAWGKSLYM
jgi:hypothetical protein